MPRGAEQRETMQRLFDLGLYNKLADLILLQDASESQFLFTERGSLKAEISTRLGEDCSKRFKMILQAINSFSHKGVTETEQAHQEKKAILWRIKEEMDFIEGIEVVFRALLKR